jgi:hypothetical protein
VPFTRRFRWRTTVLGVQPPTLLDLTLGGQTVTSAAFQLITESKQLTGELHRSDLRRCETEPITIRHSVESRFKTGPDLRRDRVFCCTFRKWLRDSRFYRLEIYVVNP